MEANSLSLSTCMRLLQAKSYGRRRLASTNKVVTTAMREANNQDFEGKFMDENMIILRMRIKSTKMMEETSSSHGPASENWMEWEKQYYCKHYHEDVCDGIGWLQMYLMNTRPCLALGILALIALSLPLSTSVVIFNVFQTLSGFYFHQ